MKKFNYAEEFNRVSDVVRLGTGFFSDAEFTTFSDAAKAKVLVQTVLGHVDEHKKNNTAKELPRNLRHEIYQCIDSTIEKMIEYRDDDLFGAMLTAELTYGINNVLAKHNAN